METLETRLYNRVKDHRDLRAEKKRIVAEFNEGIKGLEEQIDGILAAIEHGEHNHALPFGDSSDVTLTQAGERIDLDDEPTAEPTQ